MTSAERDVNTIILYLFLSPTLPYDGQVSLSMAWNCFRHFGAWAHFFERRRGIFSSGIVVRYNSCAAHLRSF